MWSTFKWMRDWISDYSWFWWWKSSVPGDKENTILLIGLDDAGKTTLTGRLTQNRLILSSPTAQPSKHEIKIGSTLLAITDVGGHKQARRLWRDYMFSSTRFIFMIDASNRRRIPEARDELLKILQDEEMRIIPMLILANKIDKVDTALSQTELIAQLQIETYLRSEQYRIQICMCSVSANEGFGDGLRWLIAQKIVSDE